MSKLTVKLLLLSTFGLLLFVSHLQAQGTEFTYQGRLLSSAGPASGSHDFEFLLWDASEGGTQLGQTVALTNVNVNNGVFSVRIDFGDQFPGAGRFLEIRVRQSGQEVFNSLTPRQAISSAPYAIKSLNSENAATATFANSAVNASRLGGINSNFYVQTGDSRLSDARDPLPNSASYIQNRTSTQAGANLNIGGNAVVGGTLFAGSVNGNGSGLTNLNAFNISSGTLPVPRGGTGLTSPGTSGNFLRSSGSGWFSSPLSPGDIPFGSPNYIQNSTALQQSSNFNISGNGRIGGTLTLGGGSVASPAVNFLSNPSTGMYHPGSHRIGFATDGRHRVLIDQQGRVVIGYFGAFSNAMLTVAGSGSYDAFDAARLDLRNPIGGTYFFHVGDTGRWQLGTGDSTRILVEAASGNVGIATGAPTDKLHVLGNIRVGTSGTNGCLKNFGGGVIAGSCSSDVRLKRSITDLPTTLERLSRLRPVHFYWRSDEFPERTLGTEQSFGLIAQEVEEIFPDLVSEDEQGMKVVNYSKLPLLTLQAVRELKANNDAVQKQVEEQSEIIRRQSDEIDTLKRFICSNYPEAGLCRGDREKGEHEK